MESLDEPYQKLGMGLQFLEKAVKEMKDDPDTYYQKSLELLEAMLTAAEFREPVEAWFE